MKNKFVLIGGSLLMLIGIFFMSMKIYQKEETKRLGFMAKEDFSTFVRDYSPRKGNPEAKVYVVEFLDPECESCRDFYPLTKELMSEYEGKIQLVIRYATFHADSKLAIKILEGAKKQNRYWEVLENLFTYQSEWGSHHHPQPERIWDHLGEAGVDVQKIKDGMNDPAIEKMIEQELADGAKLGVRGTPTFFVNGNPVDSLSYEGLKAAVDAALGE